MSFNSIHFLFFFPIVTILYFLIPHKLRYIWLLITSYYFYMSWNPKYAVLIATSTLITYVSGLLIERANKVPDKFKSLKLKKVWVLLSLLSNLGILLLFKYYNFFSESLERIFIYLRITVHLPNFDYLLPVGISFYTFQALSYTIDVYRGDIKAERNLGKYSLFVSFFPQLVAGPIEKSKDLLPQFDERHYFDYDRVKNGLLLILWGLFQKLVVADRLGLLVTTVYNTPSNYKGLEIAIATVFFAFQIYCDFSSYSDIARGSAEVMGFSLTRNFESPYLATSIKDFWRRWHISLTAWFKDYLYIPLGGNRCSKLRNYFNIMVVFITSGLWHGAALNFIVWGTLHGLYQVTGEILRPIKKVVLTIFRIKNTQQTLPYKFLQIVLTFALVNFAWIFFRANSFTDALILIRNLTLLELGEFTDGSIFKLGLDHLNFTIAIFGIGVVLTENILHRTRSIRNELNNRNMAFRWSFYLTTVLLILIFGTYGPGYNPQEFIYFQF